MKMDSLCRLRTDRQDHLYDGSINSTIPPYLSSIYQNVSFSHRILPLEGGGGGGGVFPLPFRLEEFKHLLTKSAYHYCIGQRQTQASSSTILKTSIATT